MENILNIPEFLRTYEPICHIGGEWSCLGRSCSPAKSQFEGTVSPHTYTHYLTQDNLGLWIPLIYMSELWDYMKRIRTGGTYKCNIERNIYIWLGKRTVLSKMSNNYFFKSNWLVWPSEIMSWVPCFCPLEDVSMLQLFIHLSKKFCQRL